jgi:AraC-like DNA-binding protein
MLSMRPVLELDGIVISDVRCSHGRGSATDVELAPSHAVVFVRRGCFARTVDGARHVLDSTLAYCMNPGEEQHFDHPHAHGDDCTAITVSPDLAAAVWGGEAVLPSDTVPISPQLDLRHRLLLSGAGGADDRDAMYESALALVAEALASVDARRVSAGRPYGAHAHRTAADEALEALAERPDRSLPELARAASTSPHHLSRVFHEVVGHTISRHRMRLRTRAALERLGEGEDNLARLAAELGFADQSHLCRVVRDETGSTPSALRRALRRAQ